MSLKLPKDFINWHDIGVVRKIVVTEGIAPTYLLTSPECISHSTDPYLRSPLTEIRILADEQEYEQVRAERDSLREAYERSGSVFTHLLWDIQELNKALELYDRNR